MIQLADEAFRAGQAHDQQARRFVHHKVFAAGFCADVPILDEDFQRKFYDFTFLRREFFSGEVRCIVPMLRRKKDAGKGFLGRIWIEDQGYNIVRFNGTYYPHPRGSYYLHFDSGGKMCARAFGCRP